MSTIIETKKLYTDFFTFEGVVKALNGVSVVVNEGETYGLVGESGCGKSVTVRSMMRIVQSPGKITGGKIVLFLQEGNKTQGVDILERSDAYMTSIRGDSMSMIFQEASTSLNPVLSIAYQVGESFYSHRKRQMLEETVTDLTKELSEERFFLKVLWKKMQRNLFNRELDVLTAYEKEIIRIDDQLYRLEDSRDKESMRKKTLLNNQRDSLREKSFLAEFVKKVPFLRHYKKKLDKTVKKHVIELLRSLGVANPERIVDGYPHELSGGMQQRIVIAIALACHPTLLIADEPTSNLDVTIQAQIIDLIKSLKETSISSVLFITHDLGLVAEICDRVSVMYAGDVAETAAVKELFKNPLHPYTQGLLESVPKVEQASELSTIPGVVPGLVNPPSGCRYHPRCTGKKDICSREKPQMIEYTPEHWVACHLYMEGKK